MKKLLVCLVTALFCLALAVPALAASTFVFTEKSVNLFEGESIQTVLKREGIYEEEGEITYTSSKPAVATVSEDGTITAVSKGQADISAVMTRDGKRVGQNPARIRVNVLRAVKKVTLNTTKLAVYDPDDPTVTELLWEPPMNQVIVIPAGTGVTLSTTCTPEDASSRQVAYTSSDAGVVKVSGANLKAIQKGECDLTIESVQNPEVTETFRVLVIQPVKKITVDAGDKKVAAGSNLQLSAACSPENASIQKVTWTSKHPAIATVDENGVVTGLKRGQATIVATATDGSRTAGSVTVNVTQPVESIVFSQNEIPVIVGRSVQTRATIQPSNASDRSVTWNSSDETNATVRNGQNTGKKAGTCTVYCTSNSNPEVAGSITVIVSQLVTKIENSNDPAELNLLVGQQTMTRWTVLPDDATNKGLTYKSQHPKVATVDANTGLVTAIGRGTATITATAADQSRKQGTVRVNVIQPVTGVSFQRALYYVQRGSGTTLKAVVEPRNANNQRVMWSTDNEWVASARSNGTNTGRIAGNGLGTAMITATTEDGGYTAVTQVRVGNFNEAVMIEELYVVDDTTIKIALRNMSQDITLENIHYRIDCYDIEGNPMVCNADGVSTFFEGDYPFVLGPLERTAHGAFRFRNYVIPQKLGRVVLTVVSWRDTNGITWNISEENQVKTDWFAYSPYQPPANQDYGEGVG